MASEMKKDTRIYLSYAQNDVTLKQEFEDYLIIMRQNGLISDYVEREVQRGTDWSQVIDPRLLTADLILVLVSPSLLASGYCSGAEMRKAFEKSEAGEMRVIPIILHYVSLVGNFLGTIIPLPRNGRPISSWSDRSEGWRNIDLEIRDAIKYDLQQRQP